MNDKRPGKMIFSTTQRELSESELQKIIRFVEAEVGIHLTYKKRTLIIQRLHKRLDELNIESYGEYLNFVIANNPAAAEERQILIDKITTHTTSFFREAKHFDILKDYVIPELLEKKRGGNRNFNILCAGSSTGEEAYTIAMAVKETAKYEWINGFKIDAIDISELATKTAKFGIYEKKKADKIPENLRREYVQNGKGAYADYVRMHPSIKGNISFKAGNLFHSHAYPAYNYDIIFCRNTMIYFNEERRQQLVSMFEQRLTGFGYLFISLTESLSGLEQGMKRTHSSVYQKGGV